MRRLWAHILIAFTTLILVGVSFATVFTQSKANIEFANGYEMSFRVSNKDADGSKTDERLDNEDAVNEIADIFEKRLQTAEISNYRVTKQGNDTIKVALTQETVNNYYMVIRYLSFNGSFALANANDDYVLGEDFIKGKVTLGEKNGYPYIVIPVDKDNSDYNALITATRQMEEDGAEGGETTTDEEGNSSTNYFIYLWYDYLKDYDTFSQTNQDSSDYNEQTQSKIFVKFNINSLNAIGDPEADDYQDYISTMINVDNNSDGSISLAEIKTAYMYTRFYVNLLNSSSLPYKVEFIFLENTTPWAENIFAFGEHVGLAWSRTLAATLVAVLIISLILVAYFKLGALSIATTTLASIFAGVAGMVLVSSEFNVCGLVGLVLLAISSLASGIIYLVKLSEEAYRGRSLKKANSEAAKKSTPIIIDINVILMIAGVFAYIFGGTLMRTFAAITVIGGLGSFLLNALLLRGLMWLATNTTALTGRYDLFGIDSQKVPNLMKEEKQSYFGPYADKDISKNKKPFGIAALVLLVASIAGIITFGVLNKGEVYSSGNKIEQTEIFFETTNDRSALNLTEIESILENTNVYKNDTDTISLKSYVTDDGTSYHTTTFNEEGVPVNYYFYVVKLNTNLQPTVNAAYNEGGINTTGELQTVLDSVLGLKVQDTLATVDVKTAKVTNIYQPKFVGVLLASVVSLAVSGVYLLLRYRLSRGLTAVAISASVATIAGGLFALLRLAVGPYVVLAVPAAVVISYIVAIFFMSKDKELVLDDKNRNDSVENRAAIANKANSISYYSVLILTASAGFLAADFALFGSQYSSWAFLAIAVAIGAACLLTANWFPTIYKFFYTKFKNVPKLQKASKKSNKPARQNKSAEPEEAVFIGINDY